ncbi:DUF1304 domain-containing protein [Jannaschia sp. CCS1]|uniref:DUF1304 domain-containing protein n=1 Tax=Jannaschia sp. (strain CCS1) TaxID=290400 RepID=UPI000053B129|nr:DUF1304 domain-containing protein [Jannaschia sp. CCS1]ABD54827.1 protein of unknown function DUF1304 [Jannaschia sp. CCS1]
MYRAAAVVIAVIAAVHLYIAWFEIFAWTTRGPAVFSSFPRDLFEETTAIAANQGLYNAFLSAGLIWSLLIREQKWRINVGICFLLFVIVAGVFGAVTVSSRIMLVQTAPATLGLVLLMLARRRV